jgi:flagellar basal-body rod modification protein FlgD
MASSVSAITAAESTAYQTSSSAESTSAGSEVNKETFLQLLVAQIRHQNPLSPMDGVQFLTQLAEFSNLEQLIGVREDLAAIRQSLEGMVQTAE